MNRPLLFLFGLLGATAASAAAPTAPVPPAGPTDPAPVIPDAEARASRRYDEMLDRMRAAVEDIAALYGNPTFLQVFTNDASRADELKARLRTDRSAARVADDLKDLEKKRDDLLGDIALKEREAARLSGRLVRQRAALDALAAAIESARRAVEETSR